MIDSCYCSGFALLLLLLIVQSIVIAVWYSKYLNRLDKKTTEHDNKEREMFTSVVCTGHNQTQRECRFQNLCYNKITRQYIFIHDRKSRISGLSEDGRILLDLTSVANHSAKVFSYKNISSRQFSEENYQYISGQSILFHRFNPENLMHVFHDDLVPLYYTQKKYFPTSIVNKNVNYVMTDGRENGPFFDLYSLFSHGLYTSSNLAYITCFEDVIVGLSKATTWYQYGFHTPQGPINEDNFPVEQLMNFRNDVYQQYSANQPLLSNNDESSYIVLFSRSMTRKILNENQLVFKLSVHYQMPVHVLNLERDELNDVIIMVSHASIVIGVHGAHLVTTLFIKESSTVIEIFPFAIPAEHYTPYKTLASILNVRYIAWVNPFEEKSRSHPNASPEQGGIAHLSADLQNSIKTTKTVPQHLCCHDPYWLFRINQDTFVDWESLQESLDSAI